MFSKKKMILVCALSTMTLLPLFFDLASCTMTERKALQLARYGFLIVKFLGMLQLSPSPEVLTVYLKNNEV
jgi:CRISPR/Cas system-associated protein endoribonuclease Cas2